MVIAMEDAQHTLPTFPVSPIPEKVDTEIVMGNSEMNEQEGSVLPLEPAAPMHEAYEKRLRAAVEKRRKRVRIMGFHCS